ncbi:hypothetical protein JQM63_08725 [Oscillibacter valericigenes]|nr:hypothetical protein [Oscillibacter valericigenes]
MKCTILHESAGRLRVHLCCARMTLHQADVLEYYLRAQDGVRSVKVYDRTQDAVVEEAKQRGLTHEEYHSQVQYVVAHGISSIVGFNFSLIVLGVLGLLPPTASALLHNMSTLSISLKSMTELLPDGGAQEKDAR